MMILERTVSECPLRANGKCNVVHNRNDCSADADTFPEWCPLLNDELLIRAEKLTEEK